MKPNKKIIITSLIIIILGSIAGITAYNTINQKNQKTDTISKSQKDTQIALSIGSSPNDGYVLIKGYLQTKADKKGLAKKEITITYANAGKIINKKYITDNCGTFRDQYLPWDRETTVSFDGDKEYKPTSESFRYSGLPPIKINWD